VTKVPDGPKFLLNLKTAGPNYRISILGASLDAFEHAKQGWSLKPIGILSSFFNSSVKELLDKEIDIVKDLVPSKLTRLGKLSKKNEAAGKIRVFAIADV
jgi:hypothetical protein